MHKKMSVIGFAVVLFSLMNIAFAADGLNVTINVTSPPPAAPPTIYSSAGAGLAGFLIAINDPVANFLLAVGMIGAVLMIIFALKSVFEGLLGKTGEFRDYKTGNSEYRTQ